MINLLYDGDIGPDPCDFSTISVLHEYHRRGMINLVGVIGTTPDACLTSTFSIYDQLYGHDVPIGAYHEESPHSSVACAVTQRYYEALGWACRHPDPNRVIFEKYGNRETRQAADCLHSIELYRKLLAEADDDSITIYAAGQLYNFEALLRTSADQYSDLTGEALLARKVTRFVFMGGYFPDSSVNEWYIKNTLGAEWNWWGFGSTGTTWSALCGIVALGKPVTYIGAEQGPRILVGREMAAVLGRDHPTTEAYCLSRWLSGDAPEGNPEAAFERENPAYDEITLFHAIEDGGQQPAHSRDSRRTVPRSPSISNVSPDSMRRVASPIPSTAGMPYSRARMLPMSVTSAFACGNNCVHAGVVSRRTRKTRGIRRCGHAFFERPARRCARRACTVVRQLSPTGLACETRCTSQ